MTCIGSSELGMNQWTSVGVGDGINIWTKTIGSGERKYGESMRTPNLGDLLADI